MSDGGDGGRGCVEAVVNVSLLAVTVPPLLLWEGWVVVTLWGWFVVPLGVPPLGLGAGVGLSLLVSLVSIANPRMEKNARAGDGSLLKFTCWNLFLSAVRPAFALGWGWLAHTFLS